MISHDIVEKPLAIETAENENRVSEKSRGVEGPPKSILFGSGTSSQPSATI